ncbi:NACHT domain-containing NTPase [Nostoc sp.]|uniref:NACHT domain-containing NTPase n=1 Tax=Nostoc sp. TaxID=1180 RepID=UPI002FF5531F
MPDSQDPKQVTNNLPNSQFGGGLINADTVNAKRIGGDIWNIFLGQQTTPIGNPARPKNERILLAAVKEEVTARLRQSLHNAVLINLAKESQPQQVKRPWDAEIKIGLKPAEPLPDTTTILEIFDSQEIAGKLLILGNPGAGKTTTMLDLAKALIARAEQDADYPIPVLFNLSAWKYDKQSMRDWLVLELKSKYVVRQDIGAKWLDDAKLLPMLDGLDELESARQEACVNNINKFLQSEWRSQYLVVCSRSEEYTNYKINLQLNGAIFLQPLTDKQIQAYLTRINQLELWRIIQVDTELLKLLRTSLFLSILGFISLHKALSIQEWKTLTSTQTRLEYLFGTYWETAIKRDIVTPQMESQGFKSRSYGKKKTPSEKQTQRWLLFLSQQLQKESRTEFLIEKMQLSWLINNRHKWTYRISFGMLSALIVGIIFGTFGELNVGLTFGLIGGLIGEFKEIRPVESFRFNFTDKLGKNLFKNIIYGLLTGLSFGLIGALIGEFVLRLSGRGLIAGAFFGLISGVIIGLINGLKADIQTRTKPNQGILESAKNSAVITLSILLIFVLIQGLASQTLSNIFTQPKFTSLVVCLLAASVCGCGSASGGQGGMQHFTLRLVLYFNGYIPWNYARFLDYCTERLFLQRVGGRYRFIHKLRQDHFAQMEFKRDSR